MKCQKLDDWIVWFDDFLHIQLGESSVGKVRVSLESQYV